jgi:hypothetical protein
MEAVCGLRDLLAPDEWEADNEGNQGLVINKARSISLNVAGGDKATGIASLNPSTRSPKGVKLTSAVEANCGWLFEEMNPAKAADPTNSAHIDSWLLLAYWNREQQSVQLELSLPIKMGKDSRPVDWSERILLPAIKYGDPAKMTPPIFGEGPKTPEIVIEIKRRA